MVLALMVFKLLLCLSSLNMPSSFAVLFLTLNNLKLNLRIIMQLHKTDYEKIHFIIVSKGSVIGHLGPKQTLKC